MKTRRYSETQVFRILQEVDSGTPVVDTTPQTPAQATQNIIADVQDLDLPSGMENSLVSTLESTVKSLENGQEKAAVNKLKAFVHQVEALSGKKVDSDDAQQLIRAVEEIIAFLGG